MPLSHPPLFPSRAAPTAEIVPVASRPGAGSWRNCAAGVAPRIGKILCALLLGHSALSAQECSPALRVVVGQAAGGGADSVARLVTQRLSARLGRPVVVENRVGAGNNIAAEHVAKAPKDGCTLLLRGTDHVVNTMIYTRPGYELSEFVPIARLAYGPLVIVTNVKESFKTLGSVIEFSKKNPGKLSYASTAAGSGSHIPMEMFLRDADIKIVHVPYKGAALALADVAGGFVPIGIGSVSAAQSLLQAGKLVPLAVLSSARWPSLPNVPTMSEAGFPDSNMPAWLGMFAPAGVTPAVQQVLSQELQAVLQDATVRERLGAQGWESAPSSIPEFARLLQQEERLNRKLMDTLKLKVE